jgi:hypothetical protein
VRVLGIGADQPEVPRVHPQPGRGVDRQRHGLRDRVGHTHRLEAERANREVATGRDGAQLQRARAEPLLAEPAARELDRVRRAPHRHGEALEQRGQRTDVVLVAVRQHDGAQRGAAPRQAVEARSVDVDPLILARKRHAAVDQHAIGALLEQQAVHAYLSEPA